jgi:ATP-binding cassette subfamily B protein
MTQAFTAAQGIFEILDTPAEGAKNSGALPLRELKGRVTFRNLAFSYEPGRPVLKRVDLDVRPGEFVGIVGRSGAGKTTLMHLLCRFYEPDQGTIEVDGVEIRNLGVAELRSKIGVVPQEPFLFSGSLAGNIRYGKPDAGFDAIMGAARIAGAHEFIVGRPDGYDSWIGEGGKGLSQGEKQRTALARCLVYDPRILILDEATSSVDPISERSIQRAVGRLRQNRTTFVIAHRLSTLRDADRIVVIENGEIAEQGSYGELMRQDGILAALVRLQYQTPENVSIEN